MKQTRLIVALVVLLLAPSVFTAQEIVTLSVANYHVDRVHQEVDAGILSIYLLGVNGEAVACHYTPTTNPTGAFLINALNKANLSLAYGANATTGSLKQRIFHRLVVMGESTLICGKTLTGTLAGTVP